MTTPATQPVDRELRLMGTHIRIVVDAPARTGVASPAAAADAIEALLRRYDAALSRFRPGSELCALNADPRATVPASELLRDAVSAALDAAERTDGLVDPTVYDDLLTAGYRDTWDQTRRLDLQSALAESDAPRHPARPRPEQRWREISVDDAAGTITRRPGLHLDTGGTGKGHAADLAAALLDGYTTWVVDCGGDLRVGGDSGVEREVEVEHPFTGEMFDSIRVRRSAVATSGLRSRIWRDERRRVAHHLLDPSTGEPAFSGLIAVTALAPTAVEAEALAKQALLSGPGAAAGILARHGGIAVDEAGRVARIGRLQPNPIVRLKLPPAPAFRGQAHDRT